MDIILTKKQFDSLPTRDELVHEPIVGKYKQMTYQSDIPKKSPDFAFLNPNMIQVSRDQRQRSDVSNTSDLEESIARLGVLQPIVVDQDCRLIAGERRLRACLNLMMEKIPVRFLETLTQTESKIIELEENAKREDLPWQDKCKAISEIHDLLSKENASWSVQQTSTRIGLHWTYVYENIRVRNQWHDVRIRSATDLHQANSIIARTNERKAAEIVGGIISNIGEIFEGNRNGSNSGPNRNGNDSLPNNSSADSESDTEREETGESREEVGKNRGRSEGNQEILWPKHASNSIQQDAVIDTDFIQWSESYSGPKFNLIHVDFPYETQLSARQREGEYLSGEDVYQNLFNAFCHNFDRICSYSAHIIFWFSMNSYSETKRRLESIGLWVWPYPLIWVLSNESARIVPIPGKSPRRAYHTAFLCSRGDRPLVKTVNDSYLSQTPTKPIHPTQKAESMLKHFLSSVVDSTTTVLDPTCGSAVALIAAEDLGAKQILGLELDPEYAKAANAHVNQARLLRRASLRG